MSAYTKQLAKAKALWKKGLEKKPDFGGEVPDGTYHARVTTAEVTESQSSGKLMVHWGAVILEGEQKGEKLNWYSQMTTEDNMMYLQRDIKRLGQEPPEDPSELEDVLAKISKKKPAVRLSAKTNGEFQNIRIQKLLNAEDVVEDEGAPSEPEPEEEPETTPEPEPEPETESTPEPEPEPESEEPVAEVGMRVAIDIKGKEHVGEITELLLKQGKVMVKVEGYKAFPVAAEKVRPAPKSKVTKK